MNIPENWTFKSGEVADGFDSHVKSQLPWYDLVTDAVSHIARHYICDGAMVYDIGASTGNIGRSIAPTLTARGARLIAIEESSEMCERYNAPGEIICSDAESFIYEPFDLAVCFLVLMFVRVGVRRDFLARLIQRAKQGGAVIIIDKVLAPPGYPGTIFRRLPMRWKRLTNEPDAAIIDKELSLAGSQRPINPKILPGNPVQFFQMGEFCGWLIEKAEA